MKKKILLFVAIVAMLVCLFAFSASAASTETIDGVTYYLNNGSASVTNANKSCALETVIIPEVVIGADGKEYTVKTINQQAFKDNKTIKYVSIPATMTKLDAAAFYGCSNLVFVDFNDNQNTITSYVCPLNSKASQISNEILYCLSLFSSQHFSTIAEHISNACKL